MTTISCWPCLVAIGFIIGFSQFCYADNPVSRPRSEILDIYGDPLPKGAIARLGTARFRAGDDWFRGLAITPDGTAVIAATGDRSVYVWNTSTGRLIRRIRTDPFGISGFTTSPNGKKIALAGFWTTDDGAFTQREVRVIDVASGELVRAFPRLEGNLDRHAMVFTPDSEHLISLGTEGILRVEEIDTGMEVLTREFPKGNSPELAIAPDGLTLAIASGPNPRRFVLWKWQAGEEPRDIKSFGNSGAEGPLAFSPDGTLLAGCLAAEHPLHIWHVETGRLVHHLRLSEPKKFLRGKPIFSPDGSRLFVSSHGQRSWTGFEIHEWEPSSGKYLGKHMRGGGHAVLSADGQLLAFTRGTGVRVSKWPSGEEIMPNEAAHISGINRVLVTAGDNIVTASEDETIRVWDLATKQQIHMLKHDHWVSDIAASPDGSKLVSSSNDDTVRLWDLTTGKEIYRVPGHGSRGGRRLVCCSPDGQRFCSFGGDMFLRTWDVRTGKALLEHKIRPTGVNIPEDDTDNNPIFEFFSINHAAFSSDAFLLALAFKNHHVFSSETGKELLEIDNPGSHVTGLAISPDKRFLLSAAWGKPMEVQLPDGRTRSTTENQNFIHLWDLGTGQLVRPIVLPNVNIGPAAFSPDGQRFAVSMSKPSDQIIIFDTATSRQLQLIEEIPARVRALCFGREGKTIVAGLADSTALVWDVELLSSKP